MPPRRNNFGKMSGWFYAVRSIGAEGLHFHDLRHTGNMFAAAGGTGIRDLMARMEHDSRRAALICQHRARGADKIITDSIDVHIESQRRWPDDSDGAAGSHAPAGTHPHCRDEHHLRKQEKPRIGADSRFGSRRPIRLLEMRAAKRGL